MAERLFATQLNISEFEELIIMASKASLTTEVISQTESYDGIRAGIVHLEDVLKSPSYQATLEGPGSMTQLDDGQIVDWPTKAEQC